MKAQDLLNAIRSHCPDTETSFTMDVITAALRDLANDDTPPNPTDTVGPEVGGVYETRDGREVTITGLNPLYTGTGLEVTGVVGGTALCWFREGNYYIKDVPPYRLDLVRCITPPPREPNAFERGSAKAVAEVASWPKEKQIEMQVAGAENAPETITAVYPHRVHASGRFMVDHEASLVFNNACLGEWETPLSERLDPDKRYEMAISLREVSP